MIAFLFLFWGTALLMCLSQVCDRRTMKGLSGGTKPHTDIFMVVTILWLTCFSFLRTAYNDTATYIAHFLDAESVGDFLASGKLWKLSSNPLHVLYRNWIRGMTDNYHIYFLFPAFFCNLSVIRLIKRYSVSPGFSMIIFFSIGTYVMFIAALKQSMAVSILLFAIPYAQEKKYIRFVLLVLLAMLFHFHAFVFLILPFLFHKPWGAWSWLLVFATIFALITYETTFTFVLACAQAVGVGISRAEIFDGHSIHPLRVAVYWVPGILALIFRRRLFWNSKPIENLFANMSLLCACVLTIGLAQGANLYARMAAYFEIAMAIFLPWMIKKLFTKASAQLVTVLATILYFSYFLYEFTIAKRFDQGYQAISLWEFLASLI